MSFFKIDVFLKNIIGLENILHSKNRRNSQHAALYLMSKDFTRSLELRPIVVSALLSESTNLRDLSFKFYSQLRDLNEGERIAFNKAETWLMIAKNTDDEVEKSRKRQIEIFKKRMEEKRKNSSSSIISKVLNT